MGSVLKRESAACRPFPQGGPGWRRPSGWVVDAGSKMEAALQDQLAGPPELPLLPTHHSACQRLCAQASLLVFAGLGLCVQVVGRMMMRAMEVRTLRSMQAAAAPALRAFGRTRSCRCS